MRSLQGTNSARPKQVFFIAEDSMALKGGDVALCDLAWISDGLHLPHLALVSQWHLKWQEENSSEATVSSMTMDPPVRLLFPEISCSARIG
ncbi:hypothetical protein HispidOSU_000459 [Sigmodon hispidus]